MRLVIQLSRLNAEHGPGEPFGAGVLDLETNRLITPGVNLVTTATISAAHAEIVAIWSRSRSCGSSIWAARDSPLMS